LRPGESPLPRGACSRGYRCRRWRDEEEGGWISSDTEARKTVSFDAGLTDDLITTPDSGTTSLTMTSSTGHRLFENRRSRAEGELQGDGERSFRLTWCFMMKSSERASDAVDVARSEIGQM